MLISCCHQESEHARKRQVCLRVSEPAIISHCVSQPPISSATAHGIDCLEGACAKDHVAVAGVFGNQQMYVGFHIEFVLIVPTHFSVCSL